MGNDRKKGSLRPAADVLQVLLQNSKSPLSDQFTRWRLWRFWPEAVGEVISKHSLPVGYDKGRLVVWVDNSVRLHEMTYVVGAMRDRINKYLGYHWVDSIRFTLDDRSVPKPQESEEGLREFLSKSHSNADGDPPLDR